MHSFYEIFVPAIIGSVVGIYAAYMVKLVYQYTGNPRRVDIVRFIGTISTAIVALVGVYVIRVAFGDGDDAPVSSAIAFSSMAFVSTISMWAYLSKIKMK